MRRTRCTRRQRNEREPDRDARVASVAVRLVCRCDGQLFLARGEREVVDFDRDDSVVVRGVERRAVVVLRREAVAFDRELVDFRRGAVDLVVEVLRLRAVVAFDFVFERDVVAFRFAVDLGRDVVAFRFAVDFARAVVAFRFAVDFTRDVVAFRFAVDFDFAVDFRFAVLDFTFEPDFERDELPDFARAVRDDDLVSPAWARCLLTVRAAISSARSVDSPFSFSDSLTCSY
jgi:hypothetical protein